MTVIGLPKEIKVQEHRVALTPAQVSSLVSQGHKVCVQTLAGLGSGFEDAAYQAAGAQILPSLEAVFEAASMIVKVKEPQAQERALLRKDHTLFTYLHLAADRVQTEELLQSGVTAVSYETITSQRGGLPLLRPMSEIAGRLSAQMALRFLEKPQGGPGILLSGVPGVPGAKVLIIGGGSVGYQSLLMFMGLGADVTLMDISLDRLVEIDTLHRGRVKTVASSKAAIEALLPDLDVVVGATLIPGAKANHLITRSMLGQMKPGSLLIDVAIDQGGCFETSHATTHENPVYVESDVVHYAVANMPGAVPRTATLALTAATFAYVQALAGGGLAALRADAHFAKGLNTYQGQLTHPAVGQALGMSAISAQEALGL